MYQPYTTNHKGWDHVGNLTPNIEISEGIRPAEELKPAGYLKLVRFDKYSEDYYVVSAGKTVALDSNGDVVPAGLALQAAAYKAAWDGAGGIQSANRAAGLAAVLALTGYTAGAALYDAADLDPVGSGVAVKTATGNDVPVTSFAGLGLGAALVVENFFTAQGDSVVKRIIDFDAADMAAGDNDIAADAITISSPIGIAPYNFFRWAGGDGFNPSEYTHHNYNRQHQVAVLCDYYIELPVVADKSLIKFPQISCVFDSGAALTPGTFLTFDASSDMVEWAGSEAFDDVLGQVWKIDTGYPKDYLDRVRTAYEGMGDLDKMPGTANAGLPDQISYSGGDGTLGMCRINLINR
jgi:hypothetical protein